jgi:hypothetical protein
MKVGGCPYSGQLTQAQAEEARHVGMAANRGTGVAPARPAMVFTLDETTSAQVKAWAHDHKLSCDEPRAGTLRCQNVPAQALGLPPAPGTDAEVWLAFDLKGRLVNASTWRTHLAADVASKTAGEITASLTSRLGAPSWTVGTIDAQHLSSASVDSIGNRTYRLGAEPPELRHRRARALRLGARLITPKDRGARRVRLRRARTFRRSGPVPP